MKKLSKATQVLPLVFASPGMGSDNPEGIGKYSIEEEAYGMKGSRQGQVSAYLTRFCSSCAEKRCLEMKKNNSNYHYTYMGVKCIYIYTYLVTKGT